MQLDGRYVIVTYLGRITVGCWSPSFSQPACTIFPECQFESGNQVLVFSWIDLQTTLDQIERSQECVCWTYSKSMENYVSTNGMIIFANGIFFTISPSRYLPHEMIPPRPHSRKYLVDPNSHESVLSPAEPGAAASHLATVNGPLNGELFDDSNIELNMMSKFLLQTNNERSQKINLT